MRASLNEIREIEGYLTGALAPEDRLLLEARALIDVKLRQNISAQGKLMELLRLYRHMKMRVQLQEIHSEMLRDPSRSLWRESILNYFKK